MSFSVWSDEINNTARENKSFEKALKMDMENIMMLDKEKQTAVFYAGEDTEDYNTTLSHCDCQDFRYNKKGQAPCKHIYRLALECGLIDPDAEPWATYKTYSKLYNSVTNKIKKLNINNLQKLNAYIDNSKPE